MAAQAHITIEMPRFFLVEPVNTTRPLLWTSQMTGWTKLIRVCYIYRAVLHGGYCDYDESQRQYRDIWICIYANAQFIVQIYRKYIAQTTRIQETNTYRRKWRPRDADASDGRDPETHRESRLLLTIGSCCVCYWPLWKRDKLVKLNTKPALCCGGFWFSCLRGVGGQIDRTESKRQTKQGKSTKAGNFGYKKRNNFTCFSPKSEYGL